MSAEPASPSPESMSAFIRRVLGTRPPSLRTWPRALAHEDLILHDARHRKRIAVEQIAHTHTFKKRDLLVGGLAGGVTSLASAQALSATKDPVISRHYLSASGLPQPLSKILPLRRPELIIDFLQGIQGSVVLKSAYSQEGREFRVVSGDTDAVNEALETIAVFTRNMPADHQAVMIRHGAAGLTLRMFTVGEHTAAAVIRVPLYVIGEGGKTLVQLMAEEGSRRYSCNLLGARFPENPAEFLSVQGLDPSTIPTPGSIIELTGVADLHRGGAITVDVLDQTSTELQALAVNAMWAFPGLSATAVDIFTPRLSSAEGALVLGVIPQADISEPRYPAFGTERHVGVAILDHMIERFGRSQPS